MIRLFSVNVVWTYLLNHSFTTNVLVKIMKVFRKNNEGVI